MFLICRVFLLWLYCLVCCCSLVAQSTDDVFTTVQKQLVYANRLIEQNQTEDAKVLLSKLIATAISHKLIDTHVGLSIQLSHAYCYLYTQNHFSLSLFLQLVDDCREAKAYTLLAQSYLYIALIQEMLLEEKKCLYYLDQANQLLQVYELQDVYGDYAVRRSSYHLQLTNNLDSAYYYAQEAIAYTSDKEADKTKADAYYLWGKLTDFPDWATQVDHYKKTADIHRSFDNQVGLTWTLCNLANFYRQADEMELTLQYADSIDMLLQEKELYNNYDYTALRYFNARARATYYKTKGQVDSAWHYLELSYAMDKQLSELDNADAIEKIQLQYNNEKQLAAKDQMIQAEVDRRQWLLLVVVVVLIAVILLMYYAIRLERAHRTTTLQADALTNTNTKLADALEQQIALQGEVHHRVKNNLQIIISLLELQSDEIQDQRAVKQLSTMSSRIHSMAAVHEMLYQQEDRTTVNLATYLNLLCEQVAQISSYYPLPTFQIAIVEEEFTLATAMPIGLMVNELLTNSFKYAQLAPADLLIQIQLTEENDGYRMIFRDNGVGFPHHELQEREGGLGTYLLSSMVRQLQGNLHTYNDQGAVYNIFFKPKYSTRLDADWSSFSERNDFTSPL
jgi:two-component sensor histidine kinase